MKLEGFASYGFRGLADGERRWPQAKDLLVVTGPPASGKTSLLFALAAAKEAIAPYGVPRAARACLRGGARSARVVLELALNEREVARAGLKRDRIALEALFADRTPPPTPSDDGAEDVLSHFDEEPSGHGKWFLFPDERWLPPTALPHRGSVAELRREALEPTPRKFAPLPGYARDVCLGHHGPEAKERLSRLFSELCPDKRLVGVGSAGDAESLLFQGAGLSRVYLRELSRSEQHAFLFAAMFSFARLDHSIVLIDTPELGLAPDRVVPFVQALLAAGQHSQLIVASASRELAAEAGPGATLTLRAAEEPR